MFSDFSLFDWMEGIVIVRYRKKAVAVVTHSRQAGGTFWFILNEENVMTLKVFY
jgi:hypothetical protein